MKRKIEERINTLKQDFLHRLLYGRGRFIRLARPEDHFHSMAGTVRDRVIPLWISTWNQFLDQDVRAVALISPAWHPGPRTGLHLLRLGLTDDMRAAVADLGFSLEELLELEPEPGLGGWEGEFADTLLEALTDAQLPAVGYGIRYEFGRLRREFRDGDLAESAENWIKNGNPWEIPRPETAYTVGFGGECRQRIDHMDRLRVDWFPAWTVRGTACDTPVPGAGINTVNLLRLWKSEADMSDPMTGCRRPDTGEQTGPELLTRMCYTAESGCIQGDNNLSGVSESGNIGSSSAAPAPISAPRLDQLYFLISCSLQDMIRTHQRIFRSLNTFHDAYALHLPTEEAALTVCELMRLFMDIHGMGWTAAWQTVSRTVTWTCRMPCAGEDGTLFSEASGPSDLPGLWPVDLVRDRLPRHLDILFEINHRFLKQAGAAFPDDPDRIRRMSLIQEGAQKMIRPTHLAAVAAHTISGISPAHTRFLAGGLLRDFADLWPDRFSSMPAGMSFRFWREAGNPRLCRLIQGGEGKTEQDKSPVKNNDKTETMSKPDPAFLRKWRHVKEDNKSTLGFQIEKIIGIRPDSRHFFQVQCGPVHGAQRQFLHLLQILTRYHRIKSSEDIQTGPEAIPSVHFFCGAPAPNDAMGRLIIRLIMRVSEFFRRDPDISRRLGIICLPDDTIRIRRKLMAAADLAAAPALSDRISGNSPHWTGLSAGLISGALVLTGSGILPRELQDLAGNESVRICGEKPDAVYGAAQRQAILDGTPELRNMLEMIRKGRFSAGDRGLFRPLLEELAKEDRYRVLADYAEWVKGNDGVLADYQDQERWSQQRIQAARRIEALSSANMVPDFAQKIWKLKPVPVELQDFSLERYQGR